MPSVARASAVGPQTVSSWYRRELSILNADRVRQPEVTQSRVAEVGASLARNRDSWIALLALLGIGAHLWMRYAVSYPPSWSDVPLLVVLAIGGAPLVVRLVARAVRGEFGADHLAAVSIAASVLLGEYLAGSIVVLMLAGGDTLEHFAVAEATSVLRALAKRVPTIAHRWRGNALDDVAVSEIAVGDDVSILPHEVCPVDGQVVEGHGTMDESFLTGEPFIISKGPGTKVLSGAVNGEAPLRVRATRLAADSRFGRPPVYPGRDHGRRPRVVRQRRPVALSQRGGDCHALSAFDRDPGRDHRRDLHGRPPRRHRARSRGPRAARRVPHDDPRQDRHPHRRATGRERRSLRAAVRARSGAADGRRDGAIQPSSPRGGDRARRRRCRVSTAARRVDP
jgi:hypothetical protein